MNIVKHKIVTCVFATVALCSGIVAHPQESPVKLEFKVDQKGTNKKIRIILYANGVATEPHVSDDGTFLFPSLDDEWVDVRLLSGKYDLLYTHIYLKKLRGPLTFRVFTSRSAFNRLSDTESKCLPWQKLIKAYDLNFGDGTQVTVTTCK
jgi:hypothetical protein